MPVPDVTPLPEGKVVRTKGGLIDALALDLPAWKTVMDEAGERAFRAPQVFDWLHEKRAPSFDAMSNLSKKLRAWLNENAVIAAPLVDSVKVSDDGTRKYQLRTTENPAGEGDIIEAVWLPEVSGPGQNALCISSQVGCAMGCTFCATAALKLKRHLGAGEIVGQVYSVWRDLEDAGLVEKRDEGKSPRPITHIVYMGMGEPLHNYAGVVGSVRVLTHENGVGLAPRRLTVSTSGLVPAIARLGVDTEVQIAISLNATTDAVRDQVMPVNRRWDIDALLAACRAFPLKTRRRITFEYVLLAGVNDSDDDARRLAVLLEGFQCRVNLIPFNAHPLSPFKRPSNRRVDAFRKLLSAAEVDVFVRTTRGDDIDAACGMLGAKKLEAARLGTQDAPPAAP